MDFSFFHEFRLMALIEDGSGNFSFRDGEKLSKSGEYVGWLLVFVGLLDKKSVRIEVLCNKFDSFWHKGLNTVKLYSLTTVCHSISMIGDHMSNF